VHDMLGLFERFTPKFVKQYVNLSEQILGAFRSFVADVREGRFPEEKHLYNIPEEEFAKLREMLK
ncbi:TPA: 3-methyl-2-oxobutanoate hydroxymethyltransferase, partial [Candidatus Bipolaricaulota bacterium]|nr:3-methyl-2-oxobutanoate hydroxymethyltransferase [Candidatus Bipolaricaulota bacterium]